MYFGSGGAVAGEGGRSGDDCVEAADDGVEVSDDEDGVACLGLFVDSNVDPLEEDDAWRDQT